MRASGFGYPASANLHPAQCCPAEARGRPSAPLRAGFARSRVFLLPGKQSALPQHFFAEFACQAVAQQEAGIRGIADAEARNRFFVQPAALQILSRSRSLGTLQAFLEKCGSALLRVEQLRAQFGFLRLCRT